VEVAAILRLYKEKSGDNKKELSPHDIFQIIAHAGSLVDGLVVIGGGLTGAAKYFMPALMVELNRTIGKLNGEVFPRLEMKAYFLDNMDEMKAFLNGCTIEIAVPDCSKRVIYNSNKSIGIAISKLGASTAISLGAYAFALNTIDNLYE
jgi:glucokinase